MDHRIHELESKVKSQQEQLTRYEKRLKGKDFNMKLQIAKFHKLRK